MPTERFFRLPEAKRQTIRNAAVQEFVRVPFEKASINQMIQSAGISRGSFYTYFEDKQDVLRFILEDGYRQMRKRCEVVLAENGGDIFELFLFVHEFMLGQLREAKGRIAFIRNIFSSEENIRLLWESTEDEDADSSQKTDSEFSNTWLWNRIDRSRITCESREDLDSIMTMGMSIVLTSIHQYYENPSHLDRNRKKFRQMIEMLKHGIMKKEK